MMTQTDRSARQRNFYLTVYLLPIALLAFLSALVYWASEEKYLETIDVNFGYVFALTPSFLLYVYNRHAWLKMPDGSFHYIKGISPQTKSNVEEPSKYEAEFFYSRPEKATAAFTGAGLIALSVWLGINNENAILIPVMTNIGGLFLLYSGLKGLIDKSAKLKIAKTGLWTTKLGFVYWDDINFAEVVEDKNGRTPQLYLEIRLKGTKFEEANEPDERLVLSDLKGNEMIELVINNSISKYNDLKHKPSVAGNP